MIIPTYNHILIVPFILTKAYHINSENVPKLGLEFLQIIPLMRWPDIQKILFWLVRLWEIWQVIASCSNNNILLVIACYICYFEILAKEKSLTFTLQIHHYQSSPMIVHKLPLPLYQHSISSLNRTTLIWLQRQNWIRLHTHKLFSFFPLWNNFFHFLDHRFSFQFWNFLWQRYFCKILNLLNLFN